MPYPDLKNAVQRAGLTVTAFSDQRTFFGCWSLTVKANEHTYLIVNEGREGWLMFYRQDLAGIFTELARKESSRMDDAEKASQCLIWLSGVHPLLQEREVRRWAG